MTAGLLVAACSSDTASTSETTLRSAEDGTSSTTAVPQTTEPPTTTAPTTAPATTAPPTTEPDTTPVVIDAGEWQITEAEIAALHEFVEQTHELEFAAPVEVTTLEDIGRDFAIGFEPIEEPEWVLMRAFRLVPDDLSRFGANQIRLDRIRGVCCDRSDDGAISVAVEVQSSEAATAVIIVHELVHALHRQTLRELGGEPTSERPFPWAAATEGVPQFVAFAYVQSLPEAERQAVAADLPIITDELAVDAGPGPTDFLNFVYGTGPTFTASIVDELGVDGLLELMRNPPLSNEQVLFPQTYLDGEVPIDVDPPVVADGAEILHEGRLGLAMLSFALDLDDPEDLSPLQGWSGDRYVSYRFDGQLCVTANVVMDSPTDALGLEAELQARLGDDGPAGLRVSVEGTMLTLTSCGKDDPT